MKPINKKNWIQAAALPVLAVMWTLSSTATPDSGTNNVKTVINLSNFIQPSNPKEGRDPFFPDSFRPYESAMANLHPTVEVTSLLFKGISGPPEHRLVIINNHTFAVGDEEDVLTDQGRVHVRCLEIKPNSVIVEVAGQRHELSFSGNQ